MLFSNDGEAGADDLDFEEAPFQLTPLGKDVLALVQSSREAESAGEEDDPA